MTPSQLSETQKAVQEIVDTNESLVYQAMAINEGEPSYDSVVYKLLRLGLVVTARLNDLYGANNQKVKKGQLLSANNILADLFNCHVETDNLDE
jgi:hypothetical protein